MAKAKTTSKPPKSPKAPKAPKKKAPVAVTDEVLEDLVTGHDPKNRLVEFGYSATLKKYVVKKEEASRQEFDEEAEAQEHYEFMCECSQAQYE